MKRGILFLLLCGLIVLLQRNATSLALASASGVPAPTFTSVCPAAAPGFAHCLATVATKQPLSPLATPPGSKPPYGPTALRTAYNLPAQTIIPQTVAIVAAFDDPNAESDMNMYRSHFGGWNTASETSVSSALIAAVYALAALTSATGYPSSYPYLHWGNATERVTSRKVAGKLSKNV